ncbi:MAG TPA: hypothetical protein VFU63_01840 [Ktedonobacterales bacterium]|nr:hypothetical protein [Ktedonobacterales bacterium]
MLILGLAGLGIVVTVTRRRFLALAIGAIIAIAIPFAWAIDDQGHYFFSDRQVIFILPLIYLLAAAGAGYAIRAAAAVVTDGWLGHIDWFAPFMGGSAPQSQTEHAGAARKRGVVHVVTATLFLVFALSWAVVNTPALRTVYANTWHRKEDWRGAAAFIAAHSCPDARYFSVIGGNYDFGIGYYQPRLLPASQRFADATGRNEPSPLATAQRVAFRPHDWLVLFANSGPVDGYLVEHGWTQKTFTGLHVYYRTLSCAP